MTIKFYHFLFIVLLTTNKVFAQQNFKLNGVVFEKGTTQRLALVEIKNKHLGFIVGSNDMGIFSITASIGDTLQIRKRNFNDLEVMVVSDKDLILYISRGVLLNEVEIIGQSKQQALEELRRDYRAKGSFYGGKPPILSFLFKPLTAFYELFGKTPKQARRFDRMYQNEMQNSYVDRIFNKVTINQHTGLTGRDLENFMVAYRPSYEQAKNWNVYDGIKWINEAYKKYSDTAKSVK